MRLKILRFRAWFWDVIYDVSHWMLTPWLWQGRWESKRVCDWYCSVIAGGCYGADEALARALEGKK